jgi:hypothetical protein
VVDYVDPFKSLNDIKRMEREALLNAPASQQHNRSPAIASWLSRRDYFAAAALQAILDSSQNQKVTDVVEDAVFIADKLIAALAAGGGESHD